LDPFFGAAAVNGKSTTEACILIIIPRWIGWGAGDSRVLKKKKKKGKNETAKNRKNEGSLISIAQKERCVPRQRQSMDIFLRGRAIGFAADGRVVRGPATLM